MRDDVPTGVGPDRAPSIDRLDRGLNLLFAVEVTRDVLEAVDLDELRSSDRIDDAIDTHGLVAAVGQPAGRLVTRGAAKGVFGGGVAGLVAREVAGRAGARAWRYLWEETADGAVTAADGPTEVPFIGSPEDSGRYRLEPDASGDDATQVPFVDTIEDADEDGGDGVDADVDDGHGSDDGADADVADGDEDEDGRTT